MEEKAKIPARDTRNISGLEEEYVISYDKMMNAVDEHRKVKQHLFEEIVRSGHFDKLQLNPRYEVHLRKSMSSRRMR